MRVGVCLVADGQLSLRSRNRISMRMYRLMDAAAFTLCLLLLMPVEGLVVGQQHRCRLSIPVVLCQSCMHCTIAPNRPLPHAHIQLMYLPILSSCSEM